MEKRSYLDWYRENIIHQDLHSGTGILKSNDRGKTWINSGLNDSHHIGKIVINPNNTNEIIVGSTGHLYSNSKQRGIFKSTDNGASWTNTLFIDDSTGIIDIKSKS